MTESETVAAIDIGTNAARLLVATRDPLGLEPFQSLSSEKINLRLGLSLDSRGFVSYDGIRRTVGALRHMMNIASAYKPLYRIVATHAIRAAKNHEELLHTVRRELGVDISLIDGIEEGRLIALGMHACLSIKNEETFLGVDIGGGSTEIVVAKGPNVLYVSSLTLGSATLHQIFQDRHRPRRQEVQQLQDLILMRLSPIMADLQSYSFKKALCCGGTNKALSLLYMRGQNQNAHPNTCTFKGEDLTNMANLMIRLRYPEAIQQEWGLDRNRGEFILPGALILSTITHALSIDRWTFSPAGLREGLVVDTLSRQNPKIVPGKNSSNTYQKQISLLKERYQVDEKHGEYVAHLALSLYDQSLQIDPYLIPPMKQQFHIPPRDILWGASILHESGKLINFPKYHKHSYYMILHGRLMGLSEQERRLMALVVRFHRKAHLHGRHREILDLTDHEVRTVKVLSSILRLAVAIGKMKVYSISSWSVRKQGRSLWVTLQHSPFADISLEMRHLWKEETPWREIMGATEIIWEEEERNL